MKLVICLDENNGINFNKKRQSRDKKQREDLIELIKDEKLFLKEYSYELYKEFEKNIFLVKNFENEKGYYLIEEKPKEEFLEKIDILICYFWNRNYPFTETFEDYKNKKWKEISKKDFKGNSHENITRVIYKKIGEKDE